MSMSGELPTSQVIYYSHPSGGDGYVYRMYPPNSEGFDSVGGERAQERVRRADVWAQPIQNNAGTGLRFQVNPDRWPHDVERPDPQEIMDEPGISKYAALAGAVERTLGRTGLLVIVSGPAPFKASWR